MDKNKLIVPECPVETAMLLISNKWKIFVISELLSGTKRFNELLRGIPSISQKVLTQNLRSMEEDGLVARQVFAEVPPRVEYSLSELGHSLMPVIDALAEWGMRYQSRSKPKKRKRSGAA